MFTVCCEYANKHEQRSAHRVIFLAFEGQDIIYEFKFHIVVRSVIGTGIDSVGDIDIIIDSITKNGKDHYQYWADNNYSDRVWYINELDETFYLDYLEDLPFSVYSTVYGHDENRTKKNTIDESVIKRIIRKLL